MMPLRNITARFPRIRDAGNGRVEFTLGKITWTEESDTPLLDIETDEEAIKLHARMWAVRGGFETWGELLDDPVKLTAFHAANEQMQVRRP